MHIKFKEENVRMELASFIGLLVLNNKKPHTSNVRFRDGIIHYLAEANPMMKSLEIKGLLHSIKELGQQEPITMYRGKVVDGRNRLKALAILGIKNVMVNILANNTTKEDVMSYVKAKEQRRMQTATQLAISAFKAMERDQITQAKASVMFGVDRKLVRYARNVADLDKVTLELLFQGHRIQVGEADNGKPIYTTNLKRIADYLKAKKEELHKNMNPLQDGESLDRSDEWKEKVEELLEVAKVKAEETFNSVVEKADLTNEQKDYLHSIHFTREKKLC